MSGEHSDDFRAQVRPEAGEHHHAAIRCRDMKLLMDFYERVMGLPRRNIAGDPDNPEKVWYPGLQLVHTDDPPGPQGELDHRNLRQQHPGDLRPRRGLGVYRGQTGGIQRRAGEGSAVQWRVADGPRRAYRRAGAVGATAGVRPARAVRLTPRPPLHRWRGGASVGGKFPLLCVSAGAGQGGGRIEYRPPYGPPAERGDVDSGESHE